MDVLSEAKGKAKTEAKAEGERPTWTHYTYRGNRACKHNMSPRSAKKSFISFRGDK